MYEDDVKKAEERKKQAEKATADLIRLAELEKQTAAETKKQDSLLDDIKNYATEEKPRAGNIKRILSPLAVLMPMKAIAEGNESSFKISGDPNKSALDAANAWTNAFAVTYAKQVRDTVATFVSGKDYLGDQEGGKKVAKQMGIKSELAQTVTGLALDVTTDPSNFYLWPKTVLKLMKTTGTAGLELASKSPKIEKGIEAIRRRFNVFYDIEKYGTPEEVAEFKKGFTEFAESGDAGTLTKAGYNLKKYVKSKFGTEVKDVSTQTNYKFKGEREVFTETPEYTKILNDKAELEKQLSMAKADLRALNTTGEPRTTLNDLWNKTAKVRDELQKTNLEKIAAANEVNKAVQLKGFSKDVLKQLNNPEVPKLEKQIAKLESDLAKENARLTAQRATVDVNKPAILDTTKVSGKIEKSNSKLFELNDELNAVKNQIEEANKHLELIGSKKIAKGVVSDKWAQTYADLQLHINTLMQRRRVLDKNILEESKDLINNTEKITPKNTVTLEKNKEILKSMQDGMLHLDHNIKNVELRRAAYKKETPETAELDSILKTYAESREKYVKSINIIKSDIEKTQKAIDEPVKNYVETVLDLRQFSPDDLLKLSSSDKYTKTTEKLEEARKKLSTLKLQRSTTLNELWKQYTKGTEALDLPFAIQHLDNMGLDSIKQFELFAKQTVTKTKVPKVQQLSGDINLGSYDFTKYIANKNIKDLNPKEIAELKKALEQWQKIAVKDQGSAGSWYKQFADEILPKLNNGSLTSGKASEIGNAQNKVSNIEKQLAGKEATLAALKTANTNVVKGYDHYYAVLEEAFGDAGESGIFGKTLDTTSGLFKRLMSWSPIFQSRNFMGAVQQNLSEGRGIQSYKEGLNFMRSKGSSNPELYDTLKKSGVYEQPGMYEQPMSRFPGRVAAKGEELNRVTSILADIKNNGLTAQEAIANSQRIFYKYNDAYFTKFEKAFMKRIDPFYAYDKQNIGYFAEAIFANSPFYNTMNKIKQDTKPDDEKDFPYLERDYRKDMFSIGSWGNIGSQAEDAFKMFTLDWKSAYSKTAPLIKAVVEGTFDYNIFKGVQISKDNKAGQVEHLPEPFRKAYGYNDEDKTINPWMGWGINKLLGPTEKPIMNFFDPDKDLSSVVTSTKQYKTDKASLAVQQLMQDHSDKSGGFLENNRFSGIFDLGFGPAQATADTSANTKATIDNTKAVTEYSKDILKWAKNNNTTPDKFGTEYQWNAGGEQNMAFNANITSLTNTMKAYRLSGPDFAEGQAKANEVELKIIDLREKNQKTFGGNLDEERKVVKQRQEFERIRTTKEKPYFPSEVFEGKRKMLPSAAGAQDWNEAFKEKVQFSSKTAEMRRSGDDTSPESIRRTMGVEKFAATQLYESQLGAISYENYQARLKAAEDKAERSFEKLETKFNKAQASIFKNMADASVDAFEKINYERQAAELNYYGSEEYRNALALKNSKDKQYAEAGARQIEDWKKTNNAKYDQQRREELVKQTKAHMEEVEKITKGRADNIIAALKDIYKRGGMGIEEYYKKELEQRSGQYTVKAQEALNVSDAVMASAANNNKPTIENYGIDYTVKPISKEDRKKFNVGYGITPTNEMIQNVTKQVEDVISTSKTLEEFNNRIKDIGASSYGLDLKVTLDPTKKIVQKVTEELDILRGIISDPSLDVDTRVEAMNNALELMQKRLKGINPIAMKVAINGMAEAANGLAKSSQEAASGIIDDTTKFNLAVSQMQEENSKLRAQIYNTTGRKFPGIGSIPSNGKTSPYTPSNFDPIQQELKDKQDATDAKFYKKMQETQALPADGAPVTLSQKTPNMDYTSYYQTIEAQLAEHEANKANLTEQGQIKLKQLQDDYETYLATSNANIVNAETKTLNLRLSAASNTASMLQNVASQLYEASGKKSKEAFYVMKAAAMAEAIVNGALAAIKAYKEGGPYLGPILAGISIAATGVQIGLIASQTVQGPGKAEGGPIEGGTGHKDDVPIMAMGGEYVIRKSSTKKYGASFLEALNKGLIPVNDLNFSVPAAPSPNYGQTHFAEGGQTMASNINPQKQQDAPAQDIQIVNVIDPGLLDKYLASHDGQRTLVNVLASNKYELQQVMR